MFDAFFLRLEFSLHIIWGVGMSMGKDAPFLKSLCGSVFVENATLQLDLTNLSHLWEQSSLEK